MLGMPAVIYLKLHKAESTLIGGSSALPISTLISFIYSFVILFLERLEQISAKVGHSWGGGGFWMNPSSLGILDSAFATA